MNSLTLLCLRVPKRDVNRLDTDKMPSSANELNSLHNSVPGDDLCEQFGPRSGPTKCWA